MMNFAAVTVTRKTAETGFEVVLRSRTGPVATLPPQSAAGALHRPLHPGQWRDGRVGGDRLAGIVPLRSRPLRGPGPTPGPGHSRDPRPQGCRDRCTRPRLGHLCHGRRRVRSRAELRRTAVGNLDRSGGDRHRRLRGRLVRRLRPDGGLGPGHQPAPVPGRFRHRRRRRTVGHRRAGPGNLHHLYETIFRGLGDAVAVAIGTAGSCLPGDTSGLAGRCDYTVEVQRS